MSDEKQILESAVSTYGTEAQLKMVFEEMSELEKEICKFWRGRSDTSRIAEEVADVEITIAQLKMIFGIERDCEEYKHKKLERLRRRLESLK